MLTTGNKSPPIVLGPKSRKIWWYFVNRIKNGWGIYSVIFKFCDRSIVFPKSKAQDGNSCTSDLGELQQSKQVFQEKSVLLQVFSLWVTPWTLSRIICVTGRQTGQCLPLRHHQQDRSSQPRRCFWKGAGVSPKQSSLVYFLLLQQNTQHWVMYKEKYWKLKVQDWTSLSVWLLVRASSQMASQW